MDTRTLTRAYVALLACDFPGRATKEGQELLCNLRDAIADAAHLPSKAVQESCEERARTLRASWEWP